eukprot:GILI01012051.1.p1 GENE.GILI01012051.1~~GILI01012051.1.p1  ORF type:complete len:253 (+),score=57.11 GILI01012051.1:69-761(+)
MAQPIAIIAPSILASDFSRLKDECEDVLSDKGGKVEWLHLDVMDGHFVPNITFGPPVIKSLRSHLKNAYFDCHLMISEPAKWVAEFAKAGVNQYTFHIEATSDAPALCRSIRAKNMRVGVAVKPGTPVETVFPLVDEGLIDMVLVMTVEPGFGGQSFMRDMMSKVRLVRERYPSIDIQVDGGIDLSNIEEVAAAGANAIVSGTGIFKHADPGHAISKMRECVNARFASSS